MSAVPWTTPPAFSAGVSLAAADINILRENAITIDAMSRVGRRAWLDQTDELADAGLNPSPLCRAAFQYRTGLTTLTLKVFGNNLGVAHTLRVRLNGVERGTLALNNTEQTTTITISGLGFTDLQIVEVDMDVTRPDGAPNSTYAIRDAYVSPAASVMVGAWPGLPTFGAISQANLQQLADAETWLFDRMNLVSRPVPMSWIYRTLHFWPSTRLAGRYGIARSNGANRLYATVAYVNTNTASERLRMTINSGAGYAEVDTTPTITAGQSGVYTFDVDLSGYTDEALLHVRLEQIVNTAYAAEEGAVSTRWNLRWVETGQTAWSYTIPAAFSQPRESITFSTLQTRLNSIVSCLSAVYTRMGSADMWDRIRLFRCSPTLDEYQRTYFKYRHVARSRRHTDGLWVRGKGVTLHWGPLTIKSEKQRDPAEWESLFSETLIGGETVEDKFVGFDQFPGLVAGTLYYLTGDDVRYAAEVWQ